MRTRLEGPTVLVVPWWSREEQVLSGSAHFQLQTGVFALIGSQTPVTSCFDQTEGGASTVAPPPETHTHRQKQDGRRLIRALRRGSASNQVYLSDDRIYSSPPFSSPVIRGAASVQRGAAGGWRDVPIRQENPERRGAGKISSGSSSSCLAFTESVEVDRLALDERGGRGGRLL